MGACPASAGPAPLVTGSLHRASAVWSRLTPAPPGHSSVAPLLVGQDYETPAVPGSGQPPGMCLVRCSRPQGLSPGGERHWSTRPEDARAEAGTLEAREGSLAVHNLSLGLASPWHASPGQLRPSGTAASFPRPPSGHAPGSSPCGLRALEHTVEGTVLPRICVAVGPGQVGTRVCAGCLCRSRF